MIKSYLLKKKESNLHENDVVIIFYYCIPVQSAVAVARWKHGAIESTLNLFRWLTENIVVYFQEMLFIEYPRQDGILYMLFKNRKYRNISRSSVFRKRLA